MIEDKIMKLTESLLNKGQKMIDKEIRRNGVSSKVIECQAKLNKIRHDADIFDEKESIYKNYVQ